MTTQARIVALSTEDRAPVGDVLLSRLYRATPSEIPGLVAGLQVHTRVGLAVYCHARAHLRAIARVIASSCSDSDLVRYAGPAIGASLIDARRPGGEDRHGGQPARPRVTLATKADMTRRFAIPDDEADLT